MKNKIEVLCPSKSCPRCKKFVRFLTEMIEREEWEVQLVIITQLKDLLTFKTWILPSVFVNGHKVSRGYKPTKEQIVKYLNQ